MSEQQNKLPTAKDIRNLTLAICKLTKAVLERATIEGYRAEAVGSHMPPERQVSASAVENTCISLRVEVEQLERVVLGSYNL